MGELLERGDDQDGQADGQAGQVDRQVLLPVRLLAPVLDEEAGHAQLGQREGQEDVDRVHDHQGRDAAARVEEEQDGRAAHEQDAVLHGQPVRERGEAVGEPVVDGHVGHDPRPVDEAGLGGDEEQGALREDGDQGQDAAEAPAAEDLAGQDGVEGLAGDRARRRAADSRRGCRRR